MRRRLQVANHLEGLLRVSRCFMSVSEWNTCVEQRCRKLNPLTAFVQKELRLLAVLSADFFKCLRGGGICWSRKFSHHISLRFKGLQTNMSYRSRLIVIVFLARRNRKARMALA